MQLKNELVTLFSKSCRLILPLNFIRNLALAVSREHTAKVSIKAQYI